MLRHNMTCLFYAYTVNLRYNGLSDITEEIWQAVRFFNKIIWELQKKVSEIKLIRLFFV
jgi:hypothetical protein